MTSFGFWKNEEGKLSLLMAVCNLSDLFALCPQGRCLLGLDPGSVVVGVAISDPSWTVASPLAGLARKPFESLAKTLADLCQQRNVGALIVGLPKTLDGQEGPAAQSARAFVSLLLRKGNLPVPAMPVAFWDERFSTQAVTRMMLEDDMTRKRRQETVDKAAAAYILQGALDALCLARAKAKDPSSCNV